MINGEEDLDMTLTNGAITVNEVYDRFINKCKFDITHEQKEILSGALETFSETQLEKLFFKNNLMAFLALPDIAEMFVECITDDFLNFEKPPEAIKETIGGLYELMNYFVMFKYQWQNKHNVADKMIRKAVIISDTDSTFLNIDPIVEWYKKKIGKQELDKDTRIVVCNAMVFFITKFITLVFAELTKNLNVVESMRPIVNMKSEFNFSRLILTSKKKRYAGIIVAQEGKIFTKPKFEVKGLAIKTVNTPKFARDYFNEVLEKDILGAKGINPLIPFKKLIKFEGDISNSIKSCETKYLKHGKFTSVKRYANPYGQANIRAVLLWNLMFPKNVIPEFSNINVMKLVNLEHIDFKNKLPEEYHDAIGKFLAIEYETSKKLKDENGTVYKIEKTMHTVGEKPIKAIAVPKGMTEFPEVLSELVDVNTITNDVIKNGNVLLESLGFKLISSKTTEIASNIMHI